MEQEIPNLHDPCTVLLYCKIQETLVRMCTQTIQNIKMVYEGPYTFYFKIYSLRLFLKSFFVQGFDLTCALFHFLFFTAAADALFLVIMSLVMGLQN